jgi:hypothetical protein
MDRPSVKTDYLAIINERAAAVPEGEKAWPLYRDALLEMGRTLGPNGESPDFLAAATSKPGEANWEQAEAFLNEHAESIVKIREAANRPELGFATSSSWAAYSERDRELFGVSATSDEIKAAKNQTVKDRWLIATLLPDVQLLRDPARLLAADTRRAALAGDADTAFANVVAMFGVGHHCEEKPFFVSLLVANAVQQIAYEVIQETMSDHPKL